MTNEEVVMLSSKKKLEEFKKEWCKKIDGRYRCSNCMFVIKNSSICNINAFIASANNYKRNLCRECEYRKVMAKAFDIHFTDENDCPLKECYYERKENNDATYLCGQLIQKS